jgi:hypothetical protein
MRSSAKALQVFTQGIVPELAYGSGSALLQLQIIAAVWCPLCAQELTLQTHSNKDCLIG